MSKFEAAVLPHRPVLLAYARKLTRNHEADASDLLQDTLMLAWQGWATFVAGNVRAWLHRIMHNRFVSRYRHDQQSQTHDGDVATLWILWAADAAARTERSVTDLLDVTEVDMPEEKRAVLRRYFDQDLSTAELAAAEDISIGAACARHWRAQRILRDSEAVRAYARAEYGLRRAAP